MNIVKKIYRKLNKHFLINFIKMIDPLFDKIGIYLHPKFGELKQYELLYANKTSRYLVNKKNKSFVNKGKDGKYSKLNYNIIKSLDNYYQYEIKPETGRHHQIRVQLSNIGSPIKGDLKYGAKRSNKDGSICLHAREIIFKHPVTKEELKIIAPTPQNQIWNN